MVMFGMRRCRPQAVPSEKSSAFQHLNIVTEMARQNRPLRLMFGEIAAFLAHEASVTTRSGIG
jgi:hypothetical protein